MTSILKDISVRGIYFYLLSLICIVVVLFNTQDLLDKSIRYAVFNVGGRFTYSPPEIMREGVLVESGPIELNKGVSNRQDITDNKALLTKLTENQSLSEDDKLKIRQWLRDYSDWEKNQLNEKQLFVESIIRNFVALIIFTPAFLWHFRRARHL